MSVLKPKRKKGFLKHQHDKAHSLGLEFSELADSDLKGVFAAYKMGAFKHFLVPDGYNPLQFKDFITTLADSSYLYVFRDSKAKPIALILVVGGEMVKAEVVFCPWATFKQRLAASVIFFLGTASELRAVVRVKQKDVKFMEHLKWYGVIRKVGEVELQDHSDFLYQSRVYNSLWVKQLDLGEKKNGQPQEDRQAA